MQKLPEAVQLIEKASMMYLENGTPDTAAMALERAGKLIENVDPEKAVQLYQQTANVFENEERLRQAVELLGKASRLLVRGRRFDEAAISIQKEKNIYKEIENYPTCYKKTIAQVLVHLHRNDYVAAERCVRESYSIPGFNGSEDCAALEQLLEGYDQQDQDQVAEVCNSPLFKYMDNDYAKLGLSLVVRVGSTPGTPRWGQHFLRPRAWQQREWALFLFVCFGFIFFPKSHLGNVWIRTRSPPGVQGGSEGIDTDHQAPQPRDPTVSEESTRTASLPSSFGPYAPLSGMCWSLPL
uniref:Gamma-soluble NSF attachment protein n=1 Tax=Bos mutus grunniens TaxID=30521 RepID=A0A8B9YT02_BOSMU